MEQCGRCGRFLTEVDCSTESGFDFDLVCSNKKCRDIENKLFAEECGKFVEFQNKGRE